MTLEETVKGKGRKNRYAILSQTVLKVSKKRYRSRKWSFEGAKLEQNITIRIVQAIFKQACERSGINKKVAVHTLRHSFVRHLLERSIDLRYIQELLGHKSSKATEICTHVSEAKLTKIKNPLDSLMEEKHDFS